MKRFLLVLLALASSLPALAENPALPVHQFNRMKGQYGRPIEFDSTIIFKNDADRAAFVTHLGSTPIALDSENTWLAIQNFNAGLRAPGGIDSNTADIVTDGGDFNAQGGMILGLQWMESQYQSLTPSTPSANQGRWFLGSTGWPSVQKADGTTIRFTLCAQQITILGPSAARSWTFPNFDFTLTALTVPPIATLTDAATITWTASVGASSQNVKVTLGGNRTLAMSGWTTGMTGVLEVIQDGTGSRTLTLPASSKVISGGAGAVTLTTTAAAIDILSVWYDGTTFYWTYGKNFN